jgi:hypothetical protein
MGLGAIEEVRSALEQLRRDYVVGLGGFSMARDSSLGPGPRCRFR